MKLMIAEMLTELITPVIFFLLAHIVIKYLPKKKDHA